MTSPQPSTSKKVETVEINLPEQKAEEWNRLAYLTLKKKYAKIGMVIEEAFNIRFDIPVSTNGLKSISFTGDPALQPQIETVLNVLFEDIRRPAEARRYLNRAAVSEIARQVKQTGTYVPKVFVEAANSNSPSVSFASAAKREPTQAQLDGEEKIRNNDLSFMVGPAGTGKTYIAMKIGIEMLKSGAVKRLLLARPATEAGENIGFLPGTQEDKLAPYMRPLYDELDKAFGRAKWKKMMENAEIEVVPVGFMRGRTFDDSFIIVDEAQNLNEAQMDMAATRIGYGSKMVITGDPGQIDLKPKSLSALMPFLEIMRDEPGVGVQMFEGKDCVRSVIAQTIVNAIAKKRAPKPDAATPAPVAKTSKLVDAFTKNRAKNNAAVQKKAAATPKKAAARKIKARGN